MRPYLWAFSLLPGVFTTALWAEPTASVIDKAKGKKSSLKGALLSQQSRLKKRQEAEKAAKVSDQKSKRGSQANGKGKTPLRPTIPFKSTDKILLVGEGNLSFARALIVDPPSALQYLPSENITATAYDSQEECFAKYPEAENIVEQLKVKGVTVVFGVDATKLEKCQVLKNRKYDKIMWNFPHAGEPSCSFDPVCLY